MQRRAVSLQVAGQAYRVVSSADEAELVRLAALVSERVSRVAGPGKPAPPQALLLAAISLAHEAEEARARSTRIETAARARLQGMVDRIDAALAGPQGAADPGHPST